KQINEELYDNYVTTLEEMQRICFVNSKYNRRRDYLLTTAKEAPLTAWYFLKNEDQGSMEGKRLRDEVLKYLATDSDDRRVHCKSYFSSTWVALWAVNALDESFVSGPFPKMLELRKLWADRLL